MSRRMRFGPGLVDAAALYLRQDYSIEVVAQIAAGLVGDPAARIAYALRLLEAAEDFAEPLPFHPDEDADERDRARAALEAEAREIIAKAIKGEGPPGRVRVCEEACKAAGRGASTDNAETLFREWAKIAAEIWAKSWAMIEPGNWQEGWEEYETERMGTTACGHGATKEAARKLKSIEFLRTIEHRERNGTEAFFVSVERAVQMLCGTPWFCGFLPWLRDGKAKPRPPKRKPLRAQGGTFTRQERDSEGKIRSSGEKS